MYMYGHLEYEVVIIIMALLISTTTLVTTAAAAATPALADVVTADTAQCGGDVCYDMSHVVGRMHQGVECPSGHSIAYCIGWDSGAGVDNRYLFTKTEYCQCMRFADIHTSF
jgi:hypothetical protein